MVLWFLLIFLHSEERDVDFVTDVAAFCNRCRREAWRKWGGWNGIPVFVAWGFVTQWNHVQKSPGVSFEEEETRPPLVYRFACAFFIWP